MKITANTTDAEILGGIEVARQRLMDALAARDTSDRLAKLVNEVAEAEGEAVAYIAFRGALSGGATPEQAAGTVMNIVLNGSDDGWSGRTNDAKRAKFDGLRKTASDLKWSI